MRVSNEVVTADGDTVSLCHEDVSSSVGGLQQGSVVNEDRLGLSEVDFGVQSTPSFLATAQHCHQH